MARKSAVFCVLVSTFSLGLCDTAMSQVPDSSAQTNTEASRISVQSQPITDALSNQTITFTNFFTPSTTPIPNGSGNFGSGTVLLRSYGGGQAAFTGSNSGVTLKGLYAVNLAGTLRVVADTLTAVPNGGGFLFSNFSSAVIDGQNVIFFGTSAAGTTALYRSDGTTITPILASGGTVPVTGGTLNSLTLRKIDNGQFYFFATSSTNSNLNGYYRSSLSANNNGTDLANAVPLYTQTDSNVSSNSFDESQGNIIGYNASSSSLIANINGVKVQVVSGQTPLPGGTFQSFVFGNSITSLSGSRFAFAANVALSTGGTNTGVYFYENGIYKKIADKTTSTVPFGGTGNFSSFSAPVILNGNNLYFTAFDGNNVQFNLVADVSTGNIVSKYSVNPSTSTVYVSFNLRDEGEILNASQSYSVATLPSVTTSSLSFYPLAPCRIVDTRSTATPSLPIGVPVAFTVNSGGPTFNYSSQGGSTTGCGLPSDAQAVFFNFVSVGATGSGNLQSWAFGSPIPTASTLNYANVAGLDIANGIVVPVCNPATTSCSKDLNVQANQSSTKLVIDVVGYFK